MSTGLAEEEAVRIACSASVEFEGWVARSGGSLLVSTYQAGKVAAIGFDGRQVTLLMRNFDKPLGMVVSGTRMALATRHEVTVFANAPALALEYLPERVGRYDALFLPRVSYHAGDVNTHDVAFAGGKLVAVNTRFSCLCHLGSDYSFTPFWRPSFISDTVPENRCHLNGVAIVEDEPRYVTALGATDEAGGWRSGKATGGMVIDIRTDEVVLDGLAMPHSPRWHDGRLWVLNSGAGELLAIDPSRRRAEVVCRLPGYLRGLDFSGSHALIGLSKIREKHIFGGLPIQRSNEPLRCGIAVVDLRNGSQVGLFEFTSGCEELFEVQFLPGFTRPMILSLEKPATRLAITNPESSYWLRASEEIPTETGRPRSTEPTSSSTGIAPRVAPHEEALGSQPTPGDLETRTEER